MKNKRMMETTNMIKGLRAAGWDDTKINDFLLYVAAKDESFLEKLKNNEYTN